MNLRQSPAARHEFGVVVALVATFFIILACLFPAYGQEAVLQGGPPTPGHVPQYSVSGYQQPIIMDGGGAGGGASGLNLSEIGVASRDPRGVYPSANSGNGPNGEHFCLYDAPTTNATGFHFLCLDPNAKGGGLVDYGAGGGASTLPLQIDVNGAVYPFPFAISGILGPSTTTVGDLAVWNNTAGTLLKDQAVGTGVLAAIGNPLNASGGLLGYGASLAGLSFTQIGTGAATITLDSHLKAECLEFFPDFTGSDNTDVGYNDTAWINFVNALKAQKRCGHVTGGTYAFQNQAVVDIGSVWSTGITIVGDGVLNTVFDMKTGSAPAFMLEATYTNQPNAAGTYAVPSYGFYVNFLDIGIKANVPGATFAIARSDMTDQLNALKVRVWATNSNTSASAVACQANAIYGRTLIEGTCGVSGPGDAWQLIGSSFSTYIVNGGNGAYSGTGIHITSSHWIGTAHVSGTTLTIDSTVVGTPAVNQTVVGAGMTLVGGQYPQIVSGSGSTWQLNNSQPTIASESMDSQLNRQVTYGNTIISQDTEVVLNDVVIDQLSDLGGGSNTFIGGQWNYANGGTAFTAGPKATFNNVALCPSFSNVGAVSNIVASEPGKIVALCGNNLIGGNQNITDYITNNSGTLGLSLDTLGNAYISDNVTAGVMYYEVQATGRHQWLVGSTTPATITANGINSTVGYQINGYTVMNGASPTIGSGFGTAPTLSAPVGSTSFYIQVGTGGTASTGVVNMNSTAMGGWSCSATDVSQTSASVFMTKQAGQSTTTLTLYNYTDTGATGPWGAGDVLLVNCMGI